MLGFDALGSLALGQLGRGGVTNTTMAALAGSYVVTGNAAELCRDFINWLPASSGQPEAWTARATQAETWTARIGQSESWTARAAQSDPWTPKTSQDETWTESPAGINIGEACN